MDRFPLRPSLFPNVPPYIRFLLPGQEYEPPLPDELQHLTWNAPGAVSPIVLDCVTHAGFDILDVQVRKKEDQCLGSIWDCLPICEKEKDEIDFVKLRAEAKINQFPGLFIIGRKDSLSICYEAMACKYGRSEFGFLPKTYILPQDKDELKKVLEKSRKAMIVKPPNWFCGIGIKLINRIGLKFDLRLYVLLTSIDPVKLYIYEEGLVRFATEEYTNSPEEISNNFIHLTNYSVNKDSDEFVYNESPGDYTGHKWNLSTLWRYLSDVLGIDWRPVWDKTKEICLKTVLCGHQHIKREVASQVKSEYNCYKLLGFDVFYDADLKPWLLEVNTNPTLLESRVDSYVNSSMLPEMFNLVGFHIPSEVMTQNSQNSKIRENHVCLDNRLYSSLKSKEENEKIEKFLSDFEPRHSDSENILEKLLPSDVRTILRSEDELSQTRLWTRIFPTPSTQHVLQFVSPPSYCDLLLTAWEEKFGTYLKKREEGQEVLRNLCNQMHHLQVPEIIVEMDRFPLRPSLFPNVPPYIRFLLPGQEYEPPLPDELQHLTWNAPGAVSPIVLDCVTHAGFDILDVQVRKKEDQCLGSIWDCLPICEKEKDEIDFVKLRAEAKINQFPGLFIIGRKDSLSICYEAMAGKYGRSEFGFLPKTYILPEDKDELTKVLEKSRKAMIVKPPNWFCGIGIKLINRIGLKFDLRLYVLLTSIDPIKLYIYEEGLVRFATEEYTNSPEEISNNFIHLTNYSVNKDSDEFVYNESPGDYTGHKWMKL